MTNTTTATPPDVQVARNDHGPTVTITPATETIPTEPVPGAPTPGNYQHILLNTTTGELRFHEGDQHRHPRRPGQQYANDVPPELWKSWYPGRMFYYSGPHQWFEPVPELLSWTIACGSQRRPYLTVEQANRLLEQVQPYAQQLISRLFTAGDELDWSRDAAIAGRRIVALCDPGLRNPDLPDANDDLADHGDVIARFPAIYRPQLLDYTLDKLAGECEYLTRFLGCNEHWHPEIKTVFGKPYSDGSGVGLDVLGVRAWYRTLLLGDDPRPLVAFADWDNRDTHTRAVVADMTDDDLTRWATACEREAAEQNLRLLGAHDAGRAHRFQLRENAWDRLSVVGDEVATLKAQLAAKVAERQRLVGTVATWTASDTAIAERARMSRQAVHDLRTGTTDDA